uniref:DUF3833 domain-containing protein n=1 Tax=Thaumasiovibrio occultus TaxID=1891184 RepID=UPI000B3619D6|nr:DUF3833 domain-containing protein [Thaumasiovibrio occultus]
MRNLLILFLTLFGLLGCSASVEDHRGTAPAIDIFEYFAGEVTAWGMLQDYRGKQTRRFEAQIIGTVSGNTLTLDEVFVFDDGERQTRVWTIIRNADGSYSGTAGDVIGSATGKVAGNVLHWQYQLEVALDDSTIVLTMDDWLYRQDERHMFNRTSMRKLGVEVGELTLFFQKQ